MEILFLIGRIILAVFFFQNAYNHFKHKGGLTSYAQSKHVPMPGAAVTLTGILMTLGGLSILLGVLPRLGIVLLIVFLVPTAFMMHGYWKISDTGQRQAEHIQFWKNLAIAAALLMLLSYPLPWPLAL